MAYTTVADDRLNPSQLQAFCKHRFRGDVTVFHLNAADVGKSGSEPAFTAFTRNTAERVYTFEGACNSEVAGSNPAPAIAKGAGDGAFRVSEAALARRRASAGRVILMVLGGIGVLFGLAVMAGGGFLLWSDRTQREDGYLTTPSERFATPTYALTRTRLELDTNGEGWVLNESWLGKVRIRGESRAGKTLFIGIGPQAEVARYLGSVAHANVQDLDFDPFRVTYLPVTGGVPQAAPTEQSFWAASASGSERRR